MTKIKDPCNTCPLHSTAEGCVTGCADKDNFTTSQSKMKPIACEIDTKRRNLANLPKPGGFAVNYKCPSCNEKFSIFISNKDLHYCYYCGHPLEWGGCIAYINSQMSETIKTAPADQRPLLCDEILKLINEENAETDGDDMVFIMEEDEE